MKQQQNKHGKRTNAKQTHNQRNKPLSIPYKTEVKRTYPSCLRFAIDFCYYQNVNISFSVSSKMTFCFSFMKVNVFALDEATARMCELRTLNSIY